MTKHQMHLPDEVWDGLKRYAAELSEREGRTVTTSEALRRILERSLKRQRGKK